MNRYDIILISLIVISMILFLFIKKESSIDKAIVKYDGEIVLEIDLTINQLKNYEVIGANGIVKIEAKKGQIRVVEETSPYNICSKKSWVSNANDMIICLPNLVVIELVGENDLDAVIY